jgi:hypothetical protein
MKKFVTIGMTKYTVELDNTAVIECYDISDGTYTTRQLYEIIQQWMKAESELSDAYVRIRKLVNAWDTKPGGTDRFEVTERRIQDILNERNKLYKYIDLLKSLLQGEGVYVPGIGEK